MATQEQRSRGIEAARTQILFREINDRIERLVAESGAQPPRLELLCECAAKECVQLVALSRREYESVRRVPTRFVVRPGHELPDVERTVERNDRYAVVETPREGGTVPVQLDLRRHQATAVDPA